MKQCKCILAMILAALLLAGCTGLMFTTAEYRTYHAFAAEDRCGMDKQSVLEELGCPDGCYDTQGNYQAIPYGDRENFGGSHLAENSTVWVYECWKKRDPADPCRLTVTFDSQGKCSAVELTDVPGG